MAGTLFGLPMSIQFDGDGRLATGGLFYVYDANTSTPANTYGDFALSSVNAWPLELDGVGRIPSFYVDDGAYRARLTTSGGVEIFDEQSITAIGASAGDSGDSGGSTDTENIFQTGDWLWLPISGTRSGWVRGNGRTIGSGSSGAAERANSDTQALFEYFWNNFSDAICAVSGGRGANATADFNANKAIATLDMRGRIGMGLKDMGNTDASITGASTVAATAIGASTLALTHAYLSTVALTTVAWTFAVGTSGNVQARTGGETDFVKTVSATSDSINYASGGNSATPLDTISQVTTKLSLVDNTITGTLSLNTAASQTDISLLQPSRAGTWYIKL